MLNDFFNLFMSYNHLLMMTFGLTCTTLCHELCKLRKDLVFLPLFGSLEGFYVIFKKLAIPNVLFDCPSYPFWVGLLVGMGRGVDGLRLGVIDLLKKACLKVAFIIFHFYCIINQQFNVSVFRMSFWPNMVFCAHFASKIIK